MFPAVAALEAAYLEFAHQGGLGSSELFHLGGLAADISGQSGGAYSLLAYVLRSIFLDLAEQVDDEPVTPETADHFFATLDGPVEAAINALKRPITEQRAAHLAVQLLNARRSL